MALTRDGFASWLDRYIAAWRSGDADEIGDLFSESCSYSYDGGHRYTSGREAIVKAWLNEEERGSWEAAYEPLAVDGEVHVGTGSTRYYDDGGLVRDEYSNLFVCRFDDDGRCTDFAEWYMRAPGPVGRLDA